MNNIRKILLPIDLSIASERALDYTINFLKEDKSIQVTLLYIQSNPENLVETEVNRKLEIIKEKFHSALIPGCHFEIRSGHLISAIMQAHKEHGSDLIIMGTHGSHYEEYETKTNASELVLEVSCPVLVIPENVNAFSIKNVALALGRESIDHSSPLRILHDIAMAFQANVHILTINNQGDNEVLTNDTNDNILKYYLETINYYHAFPENSNIEKGILDYVEEKSIDMLAILPRNHASNSKPSEGRLTKLLTLHSQVPVLTID